MTKTADWYFDYVSPFPYLQLARFSDLPADLEVRPRPTLFAGLLNHWGHKGPAEIEPKARHVHQFIQWAARKRGLPLAGPPRHPFNSLALLRLTEAAGATVEVVRLVYDHVWGEGHDGQAEDSVAALAARLGVEDPAARIADPELKAKVRATTEEAIACGVFGVPTFVVDRRLFWGDDATDMLLDYLADPEGFDDPAARPFADIRPAAQRIERMG